MVNITIGRFEDDPEAQGVVRPEDGRWQLVIDKDGYPHLYIQVNIEHEGSKGKGLLCIDDMLHGKMSIRDLMDGGEAFGIPTPEDEAAAYQEFLDDRKANPIPCPR